MDRQRHQSIVRPLVFGAEVVPVLQRLRLDPAFARLRDVAALLVAAAVPQS
jgi:hypothetical protein